MSLRQAIHIADTSGQDSLILFKPYLAKDYDHTEDFANDSTTIYDGVITLNGTQIDIKSNVVIWDSEPNT